jgi:2-octaprenylphenol hydroxylase
LIEAAQFKPGYSEKNFDPRVVAITPASQDLLADTGAWESIIKTRYCPYTGMDVWDGGGTGAIHFDSSDTGEPALGYIVENSLIVDKLLLLLKNTSVQVLMPATVSAINLPGADGQTLVILGDGRTLQAPLVVATDGALSPIRQMANIETREWDYGQTALIATVRTSAAHGGVARQCFTAHGPLAYLPLPDPAGSTNTHTSCFCSIVWSVDHEYAKKLQALDDIAFATQLSSAFESRLGHIVAVSNRLSFPLIQRHCKHYFKPGVVVAGDAAHTIHPLAGQGINLGLQDIAVLAEEVQRACDRRIPLSDISILQRYQRRRMGSNLAMMSVMEAFKRLFESPSPSLRWIRNEGMRQLDQSLFIKEQIARQAMGL